MIAVTLIGSFGVFTINPFCGPFVYYLYAILRPQFLWGWSEFLGLQMNEIPWSLCVAVPSIIAALLGMHSGRNDPDHPHRLTGANFTMLLFAIWISITFVTAQNHEAAWPWYVDCLKIYVMYFVSWYIIRTIKQVWVLFLMIALTLSYIAYEVNFLYVFNNYLFIYHRGYGGMDNNGAGLMLAMGVPICWFCFEGLQKWWRWAFVAFIPPLIHAVLMTYSRGAMLSLIVAVPFVLLRSRQKLRLTIALAALCVVALPIIAGPQIRARFMSIEESDIDASANSRRDSWNAAWRIAKDFPIFGVGVRNSNLFSHQYGADIEGRTIHSQYLQVLADNGFIGLGLYLMVLMTAWRALRRCQRFVRGCRPNTETRRVLAMLGGIECSMAVYCFGAIFLSLEVFELPYLLLLLAVQLGAFQHQLLDTDASSANASEEQLEAPVQLGEPYQSVAVE
jgi:probable O-glycosylation ligase (exosortase A-associated)